MLNEVGGCSKSCEKSSEMTPLLYFTQRERKDGAFFGNFPLSDVVMFDQIQENHFPVAEPFVSCGLSSAYVTKYHQNVPFRPSSAVPVNLRNRHLTNYH